MNKIETCGRPEVAGGVVKDFSISLNSRSLEHINVENMPHISIFWPVKKVIEHMSFSFKDIFFKKHLSVGYNN